MSDALSFTGRRWMSRIDSDAAPTNTVSLIEALMQSRGLLKKPTDVFFSIHRLPGLLTAIERINGAITSGEKIAIFGDYDCDGVTSTALIARMLHRRGATPLLRLPHRLHEGYGLRLPVIDELATAGITLLITTDTGVSAVKEITRAKELRIDVIVVDHHHLPQGDLPPAYAILHPSLMNPVPASPPSAAGVAWELVQAFEECSGNADWEDSDTDRALAAIGTVADLVELRGENRRVVHEGLGALGRLTKGPLALLKMHAGIESAPRSSDIAFRIAPRINAAGRMADPSVALDAVLGNPEAVLQLDLWNKDRQELVRSLTDEALERAQFEGPMICLSDARYLPGICGLIAGRVTEKLGRPSLVAYIDPQGRSTASLRSVTGFNVTEALAGCSDLLTSFGGHAMAAGCSFAHSNMDTLRIRLNSDVASRLDPSLLVPTLQIDLPVVPKLLTLELCNALQSLEPFGQGNPEPCFVLPRVQLTDARRVGKDSTHLQARVGTSKLIGFGLGHLADRSTEAMDLAVHLGIDTWQGTARPQLYLQDARTANVRVKSQ